MRRNRADILLVDQGLANTVEHARRLIMAGQVRSGTSVLVTPATLVSEDILLELVEGKRFVSRGGEKLEAALNNFSLSVKGLRCLDIGASTGGFTDCLLQNGALSVLAVDVGRGQLHNKLARDDRVTLLERTNARDISSLPPIDFFTVDVSFISLRTILPVIAKYMDDETPGVVLLKPQFEAKRSDVPKGGVIIDENIRSDVHKSFLNWLLSQGWLVSGSLDSPVLGTRGNREILISLATPSKGAALC